MRKVLLDTSFILTAVRQKLDFFHDFEMLGLQVLIPKNVIRELEGLSKKDEAKLALLIISKHKFSKIETRGKTVDSSIINFAKENPEIAIATLDKEIKNKTKNQKIVIKQKKLLEFV